MSLPSKRVWVVANTERLVPSPAKRSIYTGLVMPFITKLGLPLAVMEPEWQADGEVQPIPAGVVAITLRAEQCWHGIGDGMAVQVSPLELGMRLISAGLPNNFQLVQSGTHRPKRGDAVEGWLIEMRDRGDDGRVVLTALIEDYRAKADKGETL